MYLEDDEHQDGRRPNDEGIDQEPPKTPPEAGVLNSGEAAPAAAAELGIRGA